jgi:hypothetical protein
MAQQPLNSVLAGSDCMDEKKGSHGAHAAHARAGHTSHAVAEPTAQPALGPHPEEVQPLGEAHRHKSDPLEKRSTFFLSVCLILTIILIPILSVITYSPSLNVFVAMLPLIVTIILDIVVTKQHYKPVVLWYVLVLVHFVALGALWLINFLLPTSVNEINAVAVSILFGCIVTVIAQVATVHKAAPHEEQDDDPVNIEEYIQAIEDKAKALNFAIGRVYRNSNGGSPRVRERIRIPREWYNDFTEASQEERTGMAKVVVRRIRDRLSLYVMRERDVFSAQEIESFKNVARDRSGNDTVLNVLKGNDSDPVEATYASAVSFCDKILKELEK